MTAVIVDTNVIIAANDKANHASSDDVKRCQKRIQQIICQNETSLVDDEWRILAEYKKYFNPETSKGIGDLFVKTLLQNQCCSKICTMVTISPVQGSKTDFTEFPADQALKKFDKDDRKFIAVAIAYERAHDKKATILQALDKKWGPFQNAFAEAGVQVVFLC